MLFNLPAVNEDWDSSFLELLNTIEDELPELVHHLPLRDFIVTPLRYLVVDNSFGIIIAPILYFDDSLRKERLRKFTQALDLEVLGHFRGVRPVLLCLNLPIFMEFGQTIHVTDVLVP